MISNLHGEPLAAPGDGLADAPHAHDADPRTGDFLRPRKTARRPLARFDKLVGGDDLPRGRQHQAQRQIRHIVG